MTDSVAVVAQAGNDGLKHTCLNAAYASMCLLCCACRWRDASLRLAIISFQWAHWRQVAFETFCVSLSVRIEVAHLIAIIDSAMQRSRDAHVKLYMRGMYSPWQTKQRYVQCNGLLYAMNGLL